MKPLRLGRTRTILRAMRDQRLLVVGDVMLDEFIWGRVARISPEAPVPVVAVTHESRHIGGAGNVARNVQSLGGCPTLVGIVGQDAAATHIREELAACGVTDALVSAQDQRPTTVKTRIVAHQQQIVRADRECAEDLPAETQSALIDVVRRELRSCSALVVSDYQKGVVTPALMKAILPLARRRGVPVLVDPKVRHFSYYRRVRIVTPNQLEAEQASGVRIRDDASLREAAERIMKRIACDSVLITRGEHGLSLFQSDQRPSHVPTFAREVFDVTGAGDTVIATIALALAGGARLEEGAILANSAAGVAVGKVGTATVTPEELLEAVAGGGSGRR